MSSLLEKALEKVVALPPDERTQLHLKILAALADEILEKALCRKAGLDLAPGAGGTGGRRQG
jgi:hypothetical protein